MSSTSFTDLIFLFLLFSNRSVLHRIEHTRRTYLCPRSLCGTLSTRSLAYQYRPYRTRKCLGGGPIMYHMGAWMSFSPPYHLSLQNGVDPITRSSLDTPISSCNAKIVSNFNQTQGRYVLHCFIGSKSFIAPSTIIYGVDPLNDIS